MGEGGVHQFTSFARRGDAVYDYAELLRGIFRSWGAPSNIYVLDPDPPPYDGVADYKRYSPAPGDILLYHFAIGSRLTDFILRQPGKKFMVYHNMTPEEYLLGADNESYLAARKGARELEMMRDALDGVFAVSEYNADDLRRRGGYEEVVITPMAKDFSRFEGAAPSPARMEKWKSGKKTILFIGRVVPHKRQDDLIKVLHAYTRLYGPEARLVMPGSWKNMELYKDSLLRLSERLGIADLVEIPGFIDEEDFLALFSMADVYLSLSEHEGFGVPFLEAMWFGVPVVAYGVCAIPEVLGPSGIRLREKDSFAAAAVLRELFENRELKGRIVEGQRKRLEDFSPRRLEAVLREALASRA
ncbi:MAG: glycosyltransferase family 4 protein [Candidatus Nitrospinota bacterium M3_3B_026]